MRYFLNLLLLMVILTACTNPADVPKPEDDPQSGNGPKPEDIEAGHKPGSIVKKISGEWKADNNGAGGFNYPVSFRNYHFDYEVETNGQFVTYSLASSDVNVSFFLFDINGAASTESSRGRSVSGNKILDAGKYRIVVMADRNAVGKFELKIGGIKKEILPVPFEVVKSGQKSWSENGGGGPYVTPKNHFYTIEVTEDNTYVDLEMESKDAEIGLYLYNANGEKIAYDYGKRRHFIITKLNKGIYPVMAATQNRGSRGNYTLNITGKAVNLKKIEVNEKVIQDNIANNRDVKEYTFEITENNSVLDLEVNTPNLFLHIHLYEASGKLVDRSTSATKVNVLVARVQKGTYKVYVEPNAYGANLSGTFKLVAAGNFK